MSYTENNTIAIRKATDADAGAAISITTGESVSDPFAPTADLLILLRLRASILTEHNAPASRRRRLSIPIRKSTHDALVSAR